MHDPQNRMQRTKDRRQARRRGGKFVPLAIFLLFGLFIATQEIPQVHQWVEAIINPQQAGIRETCIREALAASRQPDFARVIEVGEVDSTSNGFLVSEVVVGEMGENGNELRYEFTCYLDADGRMVKSHREDK